MSDKYTIKEYEDGKVVGTKEVTEEEYLAVKNRASQPAEGKKDLRTLVETQSKQLEDMAELIETQGNALTKAHKEREMLLEVADKKRLSKFKMRNRGEIAPRVTVRAWETDGEEKVIVGWRSTKNLVRKNPKSQEWEEDQRTVLMFQDGTESEEMPIALFELQHQRIPCERLGVITQDGSDEKAYRLQRLDTGEELVVKDTFLN